MATRKPAAGKSTRTSLERTRKGAAGPDSAPRSVEELEAAALTAERAHEASGAECRAAEALLRDAVETGRQLTAEQHARIVAAADAYAETGKAFVAAMIARDVVEETAPKARRAKPRAK